MEGLQQVESHSSNPDQTRATRTKYGLDQKPQQSSQESSPAPSSRNDAVAVSSQETSLAPLISDWAQDVAQNPAGSGEGLIGDYGCLIDLYWDEICAAVQRHPSKLSEELFDTIDDLRRKFRLWRNGEHQPDQRLVWASSIRNALIIKLTVLTLDLQPGKTRRRAHYSLSDSISIGIKLYGPTMQKHLLQQTNQCVSHAVYLTRFALPEPREERSPADIIEFLDHAKCQDLKARVDGIYDMLPEIIHPFENLEAMEDKRPQISGIDDRKYRILQKQMNKKISKWNRKLRELVPIHLREEGSSRSAKDGSVHADEPSTLAESTAISHYPDPTDSSSDSSFSLDSTSRSSAGPMTDTNTSISISKVKERDNDLEPFERFGPRQHILIQGPSSRDDEPNPVLFDSGTQENFIIGSIVEKHGLNTQPLPDGPRTYTHINESRSDIYEDVKFRWKLSQGKKWHKSRFLVVDRLPDDLHVLIGTRTSSSLDIVFRTRLSALVAFREKKES